jgi:peptidoglycan/LPS O-acetylase OafA/YrhL
MVSPVETDQGDRGAPTSGSPGRRYDVDWLRTLALGLLIVYHIVLCFQSWASAIRFPQNDQLLEGVWPAMAALNVWRIPLLFLISGMGVRFAMERRDWKALLIDRTVRIGVPYVFGIVVLNLLFAALLPVWGWRADFTLHFGHLWFLLNIYLYTMWTFGIMISLKDNPENPVFRFLRGVIRHPLGLLLMALPVVIEAQLVNPTYFSSYVDTLHGWLLGFVCFCLGLIFASLQEVFWPAVARLRWIALALAGAAFLVRWLVFELETRSNGLTGLESMAWMLAILGFGAVYLNRPSRTLGYLSRAVYPVYIVHLPVQFVIAYFLLPRPLPAAGKLVVMLAGTFGLCFLLYELVLRRVKWIRPLFGMKLN